MKGNPMKYPIGIQSFETIRKGGYYNGSGNWSASNLSATTNLISVKSNTVYIVFLIILIIAVIGLVVFIVYYLKKPRKSKAFELDDDNFDYEPSK